MEEEKVELAPVRLPRQDKTGLILGLTVIPLIVVIICAFLAMLSFIFMPVPANFIVGLIWLALGGVFGWVRVKGRTLFEWIPVFISFTQAKANGQNQYRRGSGRQDDKADQVALQKVREADERAAIEAMEWGEVPPGKTPEPIKFTLPGQANEFQLYSSPAGRGVLYDPVKRRVTVTMAVSNNRSFDLQEKRTQANIITDYGNLLDLTLPVAEVLAVIPTDITSLESQEETLEYFRKQRELNGAEDTNPVARAGYEAYLANNLMAFHMQYYTVVLGVDAMRQRIKEHGSNMAGLLSAVDSICNSIGRDFADSKTKTLGWLSALERRDAVYKCLTSDESEPVVGAHGYWDSIHVNDLWHKAYVVEEWPQKEVTPGFMSKVTRDLDFAHAVSLVYENGSGDASLRKVSWQIKDKENALSAKQKGGFRITRADRIELEDLEQREAELTAGSSEMLVRGFISITASSKEELKMKDRDMRSAATKAGLVIYPCWNQQFAGLLAAGSLIGLGLD